MSRVIPSSRFKKDNTKKDPYRIDKRNTVGTDPSRFRKDNTHPVVVIPSDPSQFKKDNVNPVDQTQPVVSSRSRFKKDNTKKDPYSLDKRPGMEAGPSTSTASSLSGRIRSKRIHSHRVHHQSSYLYSRSFSHWIQKALLFQKRKRLSSHHLLVGKRKLFKRSRFVKNNMKGSISNPSSPGKPVPSEHSLPSHHHHHHLHRHLSQQQLGSTRKKHDVSNRQLRTVIIEGVRYRLTRNKLTRSNSIVGDSQETGKRVKGFKTVPRIKDSTVILNVRGSKFALDPSGRTLKRLPSKHDPVAVPGKSSRRFSVKRVDVGGTTFVEKQPNSGVYVRSYVNQVRSQASKVVKKSINSIYKLEKKRKKSLSEDPSKKSLCLFFSRFGKCSRQSSCPFLHDPEKIAVCSLFLRGTCKKPNECLFSHKTIPEKTPVCEYFLQGVCSRESCPYRHVNVGLDAGICKNFIRLGHCYRQNCPRHHLMVCPDFAKKGICVKKKCSLRHSRLLGIFLKQDDKIEEEEKETVKTPETREETKDFMPLASSGSEDEEDDMTDEADIQITLHPIKVVF